MGALGEVALMKHLGIKVEYDKCVIPWELYGQIKAQIYDVGEYEVKCIDNPSYNMICQASGLREDKLDRKYVLILVASNVAIIQGWCYGHEFKSLGTYVDMKRRDRPPFYKITKDKLKPWKDTELC